MKRFAFSNYINNAANARLISESQKGGESVRQREKISGILPPWLFDSLAL
jgi:hypothetical protein